MNFNVQKRAINNVEMWPTNQFNGLIKLDFLR